MGDVIHFSLRLNLEKQVEQFQYWADSFEMLPMYFMCFYGAQNIETVIEVSNARCSSFSTVAVSRLMVRLIFFFTNSVVFADHDSRCLCIRH